MKDLFIVIKKELTRFFTDKRIVFGLIFPGVLLFIIYSAMGQMIGSINSTEGHVYQIAMTNAPEQYTSSLKVGKVEYELVDETDLEKNKESLLNEDLDLVIIFEEDFINKLTDIKQPTVNMYYNPTNNASSEIYNMSKEILFALSNLVIEDQIGTNQLMIFNQDSEVFEVKKVSSQLFSTMVPMLLVSFISASILSIAPDSITGEKERGSFGLLLMTPIKRYKVVLGKILSISIVSIIGSTSSLIGIIFGLQKLMQGASGVESIPISYGAAEYAVIGVGVFSFLFPLVGIFCLICAFSKSVKEASTLCSPLMIVLMVLGLLTGNIDSLSLGAASSVIYAIPLFNSLKLVSDGLNFSISGAAIGITIAVNFVFTVLLAYLTARLLSQEKFVFNN